MILLEQKERVQSKEVTAGTMHNYVKTIKMFCEETDIVIPWKNITRGLSSMASSGIRVGAWDHLKWNNISPIVSRDGKLVAAKINVYAGEDDEYIRFITPEAYLSLQSWMTYRSACREHVIKDGLVMRELWNATKLPMKEEKGKINEPIKLQSIGVNRLFERALWAQGVRTQRGARSAMNSRQIMTFVSGIKLSAKWLE